MQTNSAWRKNSYNGGATGNCVGVGTWRKSSYSGGSTGNCVEVAASSAILIRDTTDRGGVTLSLPAPAWHAFITRINRAD
jgi:hypothetical protein